MVACIVFRDFGIRTVVVLFLRGLFLLFWVVCVWGSGVLLGVFACIVLCLCVAFWCVVSCFEDFDFGYILVLDFM